MQERKIPITYLLLLVALLAIACLTIVLLSKDLHQANVMLNQRGNAEFPDIAYDLGVELFKTIFIGLCLGIGVEIYLRRLKGDSTKVMLEKMGIQKVYRSRQDAKNRFEQLVDDPRVKNIYIVGISLREFLTQQGGMQSVWEAIQQRLSAEEHTSDRKKLSEDRRLKVHLLVLDPLSSEGYFRYTVERPYWKDHPKDIWDAVAEVDQARQNIYGAEQNFLKLRLYEHCPFSFVLFTEIAAFVEQYYYKRKAKSSSFPLIEYSQDSDHYTELRKSVVGVIWEHAYEKSPSVGTAVPLRRAGIKNIFRIDQRREQAARQIERIAETNAGTIKILTITGRHFVNDPDAIVALKEAASKPGVTIQFALLNPISQQAIFRAIADKAVTDTKIKKVIAEYDWGRHKTSRLYRRVHDSIRELQNWKDEGLKVETRLYSCSVTSALLLTPTSAFAGKYLYGRSKKLEDHPDLQSEYPFIEFDAASVEAAERIELELLECTFRVIWNHYSIAVDTFFPLDDEPKFNQNLQRLNDELNWGILSS